MSNKLRHVVGFIKQSLPFCFIFLSLVTKTVIAVIDEITRVQRRTGNSAIVVHGV